MGVEETSVVRQQHSNFLDILKPLDASRERCVAVLRGSADCPCLHGRGHQQAEGQQRCGKYRCQARCARVFADGEDVHGGPPGRIAKMNANDTTGTPKARYAGALTSTGKTSFAASTTEPSFSGPSPHRLRNQWFIGSE